MKKYKKLIAGVLVCSISMGFSNLSIAKAQRLKEGEVLADKRETVYGILNYDGSANELSVINRISNNNDKIIVDYGDYTVVNSLDDNYIINTNKDKISIESSENGEKTDFISYEGKTNKKLPIDINLKYYLDGKEVSEKELAGSTGHLKIEGKLTNNEKIINTINYTDANGKQSKKEVEGYTPLSVQIALALDLDKYYNIEAKDATQVTVGNKTNISYGVLPYPEGEFVLEADVKELELPSITFNILAKEPQINSLENIIEPMKNMYTSMKSMTSNLSTGDIKAPNTNDIQKYKAGLSSVTNGANEILGKTIELKETLKSIEAGKNGLEQGINELKNGVSQMENALAKVTEASKEINAGSINLDSGIDKVNSGLAQINTSLQGLGNNQENIKEVLTKLIEQDPQNTAIYQNLIAQANAIVEIADKTNILANESLKLKEGSTSLVEGTKELSSSLEMISSNTLKINEGLDSINTGVNTLLQSMEAVLAGFNKYLDGVENFSGGVLTFTKESQAIVGAIESIAKMASNLESMNTNKINQSLNELKDALDNLIITEETTKVMKANCNNYKSFMNNELNTNSTVNFIIKTKEVKKN